MTTSQRKLELQIQLECKGILIGEQVKSSPSIKIADATATSRHLPDLKHAMLDSHDYTKRQLMCFK